MSGPTVAAMVAHVEAIAAEHDVTIGSGDVFVARPLMRMIWIPPIVTLADYYSALHELGHVVGRGRSKPILEREANAWVYAIATARWPLTDEVRLDIREAIRSYGGIMPILKNGRIGTRWRAEPPEDHPYWTLCEIGDVVPPDGEP